MLDKYVKRMKRAKKTRCALKKQKAVRLAVYRSNNNIYAQLIEMDKVILQASTLSAELRTSLKNGSNIEAAKEVGKLIAKKALEKGISKVAFDRSGYLYHGRVKALADAVRESGLQI